MMFPENSLLYSPFQGQKCLSNPFSQAYFYRFLANLKELVWSDPTAQIHSTTPGIKDGQHLRLKGMGEEGKGGGESGDLYLKVRVMKSWLQRIKELLLG